MRILIIVTAAIAAFSGSMVQAKAAPRLKAAAPAAKASGAEPAPKSAGPTVPNFDAMMSAVDKMFPRQPDPDPARLALARTSVAVMWPDGAYAKMMSGFVGNMMTGVMQMKKSDLESLGNKAPKASAAAAAADPTIHDQAAAKDPYFDQRIAAVHRVIDEEIAKLSLIIDPRMRDGLARSMARRFDARQLGDMNAFFATPSGQALASNYMQLWLDPDTLRSMIGAVPEMMKLMPDAMQQIKAANDKFPKPPAGKATKH